MIKRLGQGVIALCTFLLLAGGAFAQGNPHLVSVDWLKANINSPNVVLIDAATTFKYLDGHIPGAISASFPEKQASSLNIPVSYGGGMDFFHDRGAPIPIWASTDRGQIQAAFQKMGINSNSRVIVYDHGEYMLAARLFFELVYWRFANVAILDGGYDKWVATGNPTTKEVTAAKAGNVVIADTPDSSLMSDTNDILQAQLETDKNQIFSILGDTTHYQYRYYYRYGHIPTAINLPPAEFFNADKTYKSPEELMKIFAFMGGDPNKHIHTH